MTEEQLCQQLYDRASKELDAYIADLKTKTPEQIINRAYEVSVKQDFLMVLEEHEFPKRHLQELCKLEHPLDVFYQRWLHQDDSRMGELHSTIQDYAGDQLRNQAEQLFADPKTPRYPGTYQDAVARDEIYQYRASRNRDTRCLNAFSEGVSDANFNQAMRPFIQKWTEDYGHDRCKFILGYSVQRADWDKRYSPKAKQDAQQYDYHITTDHDLYSSYCTNAHPCLVNCAYELLMEQGRGRQMQAPQKNEMER